MKKKRIKAQRVKPPTLPQAIDAFIGDEEQNEKQKKKKEAGSGLPTQLPWTLQLPHTNQRDNKVRERETHTQKDR